MKGHPDFHLAIEAGDGNDEYEDEYEIASNDHRLTGIEKNPGPIIARVNH